MIITAAFSMRVSNAEVSECLICTQKCRFMGKKVCEISRFFSRRRVSSPSPSGAYRTLPYPKIYTPQYYRVLESMKG